MSKHTVQDWMAEGNTVYALNAEGSNRFCAQVQPGWATDGRLRTEKEEVEANARIMACALDMLAILVESQKFIGGDWRERRDAVIAKALGDYQ